MPGKGNKNGTNVVAQLEGMLRGEGCAWVTQMGGWQPDVVAFILSIGSISVIFYLLSPLVFSCFFSIKMHKYPRRQTD